MVRPIGNKQKEIFYVSTIRHWVICIPISEYKFQSLMTLLSVLKYHSSSIPSLFLGSLETNGKWKSLTRTENKISIHSISYLIDHAQHFVCTTTSVDFPSSTVEIFFPPPTRRSFVTWFFPMADEVESLSVEAALDGYQQSAGAVAVIFLPTLSKSHR